MPKTSTRRTRPATILTVAALLCLPLACGDDDGAPPFEPAFESTRLCPLVSPPLDASESATVPYGTDLGFSYEHAGVITVLFGDTWDQIETCPLQANDDSLATLEVDDDWPGFTARQPLDQEDCADLRVELTPQEDAFEPILLELWDGTPVPMGPLNTPLAGFSDGAREWGVFIVGAPISCDDGAAAGDPCPPGRDPIPGSFECAAVGSDLLCVDPDSPQGTASARRATQLHIAERVGTTSYVSRAVYTTNKFLNLTVRAVRAFAPEARSFDYRVGANALLGWGRPGFDATGDGGSAPPYFFYLPLPLEVSEDGRIAFEPRYFTGASNGGAPSFAADQAEAAPLYGDEFDLVNQTSLSFIPPLGRWLMLYGGDLPAPVDLPPPDPQHEQPYPGAIHGRLALDPWGPWSDPQPLLTPETMAPRLVCKADGSPAGCLQRPDPPIRPLCLAGLDPEGAGRLYGAAMIDALTHPVTAENGSGPAAAVYWIVSTWNPYAVVLVKTRIENATGASDHSSAIGK